MFRLRVHNALGPTALLPCLSAADAMVMEPPSESAAGSPHLPPPGGLPSNGTSKSFALHGLSSPKTPKGISPALKLWHSGFCYGWPMKPPVAPASGSASPPPAATTALLKPPSTNCSQRPSRLASFWRSGRRNRLEKFARSGHARRFAVRRYLRKLAHEVTLVSAEVPWSQGLLDVASTRGGGLSGLTFTGLLRR